MSHNRYTYMTKNDAVVSGMAYEEYIWRHERAI